MCLPVTTCAVLPFEDESVERKALQAQVGTMPPFSVQ
jgi:hypothetical protein